MKKQQLSAEQKRLETDLWIIALVTLGVFLFYAATGKQLTSFVANSNISVIPRLLLNAGVQFGVAGLGITIVCILRKESFTHFGLIRKNIFNQIINKVPIDCFINQSQHMVLRYHVIHGEHHHLFSFFICIFCHHKKHRPSDFYYIRKAVPTIAKPCKSRALSTV